MAKTLLCDPKPRQHPQQGFKSQLTQPLGMSGRRGTRPLCSGHWGHSAAQQIAPWGSLHLILVQGSKGKRAFPADLPNPAPQCGVPPCSLMQQQHIVISAVLQRQVPLSCLHWAHPPHCAPGATPQGEKKKTIKAISTIRTGLMLINSS